MSGHASNHKVPRVAYIMSASYSGSTLLTFLLGTHEKVATVGELKASAIGDVDAYRCSCGEPLLQCGFWQRVADRANENCERFEFSDFETHFRARGQKPLDWLLRTAVRGDGFEWLRDRALQWWPGHAGAFHRIMRRNDVLVRSVLDITHADIFVDGSKEPVRLKFLLDHAAWDIQVIFLVRDGRGVTNSYRGHNQTTIDEAARQWTRVQEECERIIQRLPTDRYILIHYEDLCGEPRETLNRIFEFIGLNGEEARLDFRAVQQHILGNAMRLTSDGEIRLDEKWKSAMSHADLVEFDLIAGPMNRRFGYE